MKELFINGKLLDLSDSTNIGINFSANNIGEIQDRQSNFSNTFKIPITKINSEIIEWSHIQISSSLMPYRKNKATYSENGIEIVSDGFCEVVSVDKDFYYLNVYSGNFSFIDSIGDLTVGELYSSDTIYNWTLTNVLKQNEYFIFPLIDWRKDLDTFFQTNTIDVRQMLPCVSIPKMFDRLKLKTGFNFNGSYLTSSDHLSSVLTLNNFEKLQPETLKATNDILNDNFYSNPVQISSGTAISSVYFFPTFNVSFPGSPFNQGPAFKPLANEIGSLRFAGTFMLYWFDSSAQANNTTKYVTVVARIVDDLGTIIKEDASTVIEFQSPAQISPHFVLDIETPEYTFLTARSYTVEIECKIEQKNVTTGFNFLPFDLFFHVDSVGNQIPVYDNQNNGFLRSLTFTSSKKIPFGTALNFFDLFTMKVKDVLKDILNMRGVIIQTNNYTKTVQFNNFEDVKLNQSKAKDWSSKLQLGSVQIGFKFSNYARTNKMRFKEDSDKEMFVLDKSETSFIVDNENLEDEKVVLQLLHPATVEENRFNSFSIPLINQLKDGNNEFLKNDWRILKLKKQSVSVDYTDGTTTQNLAVNVPFCDFVPLDELKDKYYPSLIESLNQAKIMRAEFNLNSTDISDLDFTIPIYLDVPIESINGYFYLNKIENYKGNITKCEIIRL